MLERLYSGVFDNPNAPAVNDVIDMWFDDANMHGWYTGSPQDICGTGETSSSTYIGVIAAGGTLHVWESSACFTWDEPMALGQFAPFTAVGAPAISDIQASFICNGTFFIVTQD